MKNLLTLIGVAFVGYMIYTHPTTKDVSKCVAKQIPSVNTDKVIDDVAKKAKKVKKELDKANETD